METQLATKAEFAAMIGVSAGRISQLISAKKLGPDELEGEGRSARVRVGPALQALKVRLHQGQMTGNGLGTKLTAPPPLPLSEAPRSEADLLEISYKQAKLAEQLARNRKQQEEEKARQGIYILSGDAQAEMTRVASQILQGFEGGIGDMATAIAAQFQLPQRDVVHLMQAQFREVRQKIADRLATEGRAMPATIEAPDAEAP